MKIAAVKKFTQVLVAMAVAAVMAALLCAPKALGTTIGEFSIEQIYVNVPELDVFVQATDAQGQPISPDLVRAAGVELYLGDEKIPTGNIGMANEPICYVLAVDNSVDETTLKEYRIALRRLISAKGAKDQIMLYTLAGSIAPRKVIFALTEAGNTATSTALLGAVAKDAASRLNMPLDIFVTVDDANPLAELGKALGGDKLDVVHESELADTLAEKQQALANALEIKTAVDENFYGERLDVLTLSVPQLGSAVKTNATVYMGHRLAKPAVESVTLHGRYAMTIRFNQAVGRAEDLTCYSIQSEDIWGWHVKVKQALASADGRSVSLYTEPLYQGTYTIKLNKMTSAMTAANVSDSGTVYRFTVEDWPKDRAFYLARFRLPAIILGGLLVVLAAAALLRGRKERTEEKLAEAEHLLTDAAPVQQSLPRRWITLYLSTRRGIAETRWSAYVESSLIIGSDATQCDLCLADGRTRPQHAVLEVESSGVTLRPLDGAAVMVNGDPIGGEYRLQNGDTIKIGRTTLRLVL